MADPTPAWAVTLGSQISGAQHESFDSACDDCREIAAAMPVLRARTRQETIQWLKDNGVEGRYGPIASGGTEKT